MASTGIDRNTGRILTGFDHVLQSVEVIFTTRLAARLMLYWFGSGLVELLGRRIVPRTLSIYVTLLALAIRTWEPRLEVIAVKATGNTADKVSLGELRFEVQCYYRPNGHLGDFTIEGGLRRIGIAANDDRTGVTVSRAA